MVAGRPREHDRIQIGKDLVKWAKENPLALTIPMFATSIGLNSSILRKWCVESKEFRSLYMQAKEFVGINRLNCTQDSSPFKLDNSIYRGTLHHYDYDIREDIRDEKTFESNLKQKEIEKSAIGIEDAKALSDLIKSMPQVKNSVVKSPSS